MRLGRVVGTVVASVKTDGLDGVKLLIVQPLSRKLEVVGDPVVAADGVAILFSKDDPVQEALIRAFVENI